MNEGLKTTYKFHPRVGGDANPAQAFVTFGQFVDLSSCISFWVEQRDGFDKVFVHAIASVLGWHDPFHARFGGAFNELCLLSHGHEAKSEDGCVDIAECVLEEVGLGV